MISRSRPPCPPMRGMGNPRAPKPISPDDKAILLPPSHTLRSPSLTPSDIYQLHPHLQVFSLPTIGKLVFMLAVTSPIVLLGAALYHIVTQRQREEFSASLAKSYYTVTGFPEFQEEPPAGGRVLMLLHILGVSTFAG